MPALVKTRRLGYDGKGQRLVESAEPLGAGQVAEEIVPFDRELSIVAVAGATARRASTHSPRTCTATGSCASRARLRRTRRSAEAEEIATSLLDALGYVGVLAVELFEVDGRLLANEFAPRVHNTGHWTIEAPRRASSRTTCARSSACRSARPSAMARR